MKQEWAGHYLDGKTPARHPVTVRLFKSGIEIQFAPGRAVVWPYTEIQQTQGNYKGEDIRLEKGGDLPEAIIIGETEFLSALHELAPGHTFRFHNPRRRPLRIQLTIFAAFGAVFLALLLYFYGIPAFVTVVTPLVPVAWEDKLGQSFIDQLAPEESRCQDPAGNRAIMDMVAVLTAGDKEKPYHLRVYVIDDPLFNAMAAPGGHIVIFRGLLEGSESAEELAGVLAHEIQHVLKRHTTRALLQQASLAILVSAVAGDPSGAVALAVQGAATAGNLNYSRQSETEADEEGMKMILESGINPKGMISFFQKLEENGAEIPNFLKFLSTHPATPDRIKNLRLIAIRTPGDFQALPQNENWETIRSMCGDTPEQSSENLSETVTTPEIFTP